MMPPRNQDLSMFLASPHPKLALYYSHIMCRRRRMGHVFWFLLLKHREPFLGTPNRIPQLFTGRFEAHPTLKPKIGKGNGMALIGLGCLK